MNIIEKETKIWHGTYRGVSFEINNFKGNNWTYYLIIHLNKIPLENNPNSLWLKGKKDDKGRVFYSYYKNFLINNIDFHGGCTWYSKEAGFDGENKVIKIGCDYQHYWDEGKEYDIEDLKLDVKNSIDSFLTFIPNYKYWCCGNGNLYLLKDGLERNGKFYSKEYWGNYDWYKELELTNN